MFRAGIMSSFGLASAVLYCPDENDFTGGHWTGNGWSITGSARVSGKQTFNLLGGYVEFDMDTTHAHTNVNNNFYLVSPDPSYFPKYCDIQGQNKPTCMEMDIIEMNGNCVGQTTWHTYGNHNGGCDRGGCWGKKYRSGKSHIKAEFATNGWMDVYIDGAKVAVNNPTPNAAETKIVHDTMARLGAQIESSQWQGWVPSGNCPGNGGMSDSTFSITNIRVSGTLVQGPEAASCGPTPPPTPPAPTPPPTPTTGGNCCYSGCSSCTSSSYCKQSQQNCEGNCGGKWCPGAFDLVNTTVTV